MPIAAIDLFCGIGGLTKGLSLAGIDVVAGIDIESSCKYIYEANNPNAKFIHADVSQVRAADIVSFYPVDAVRVLTGCAPCQPFSNYTNRYRKEGFMDDKWRLLYSFLNHIEVIQPDIVAMENVPQIINQKVFHDFVKRLAEINYSVHFQIVYCPDYGVPQKRKRLVLLASRLGEIDLIPKLYNEENYLTVRHAIGNLPKLHDGEASIDDPIHVCSRLSEINFQRIKHSRQNGTWRDWPQNLQLKCHKKDTGRTYPSVYGRMGWDEPSPTITTQFYGYGNGRFGHPEQHRALSIREGAILQSFPSDYIFFKDGESINKRILGMQIGNAVPVELGRAIGISIVRHIRGVRDNERNIIEK